MRPVAPRIDSAVSGRALSHVGSPVEWTVLRSRSMKRILPLALVVASAGWIYACSDDKVEEPATNVDGGGNTDNDSGSNPGTDSGGPKEDGGTPDAPVTPTGNPIDGVAAAKAITPGDFNDFADGPIWRNNKLYYTLPLSYLVVEFTPPSTFATVRDYNATNPIFAPIGQTFDTKTSTVITAEAEISANPTANRLVRWTADAGATTAITLSFDAGSGPSPFDSPNDVVARADGTLYVTDPGYQRDQAGGNFTNRIVRVTATGQVFEEKLFANEERPNGIALSPDGNSLYVSFSATGKVAKYPVAANGTLGAEAAFGTVTEPDGMNVDTGGNVYVAAKGGVEVFKPDGTKWGTVATPKQATGCAFGGADMKTLYITAQGAVYEVTGLKVAGSAE